MMAAQCTAAMWQPRPGADQRAPASNCGVNGMSLTPMSSPARLNSVVTCPRRWVARLKTTVQPLAERGHQPAPLDRDHRGVRRRPQGAGKPRFTVTLFFWVKLSSMPSSENSRPMPLCFTPP